MIYLYGSILASTLIFVIFRLFPHFKVDTLQAIVFNYFTACILGFLLFGSQFSPEARADLSWVPLVLVCGALFISLFLVMGISSQRNGVGLTSVAVKMSMSFGMLLVILANGEQVDLLKISGFVLAVVSVVLMSLSPQNTSRENRPIIWMLAVLFLGSGLLDFGLNYAQNHVLQHLPNSLFSAFGFGVAGCVGMSILLVDYMQKKRQFSMRQVVAGIVLGVPNYFSIYLLMQSYQQLKWTDSSVMAITNISIVTLSAVIGFMAFREKVTSLRIIGLCAAIVAIYLLSLC